MVGARTPPPPPAAPTTTATLAPLLAVSAGRATRATTTATSTPPPFSALRSATIAGRRFGTEGSHGGPGRGGGHHLDPRPEVRIDLYDADLRDVAGRGRHAAPARPAAEPGATRRHIPRRLRRCAVGRRRRRRRRHRNVVLIGHGRFWSGRRSVRLNLLDALRHLVRTLPAHRLLQQAERIAEREAALLLDCGGGSGGLDRLHGGLPWLTLFAAPSSTTATTPPAAAFPLARRALGDRCGKGAEGRLRQRPDHLWAEGDLVLAVVEPGQRDEATVRRFDDELAEAREARVLLVEVGIDLLHDLLQAIGAHDVVVGRHLLDRLDDQLPGIAPHVLHFALLGEAGELIVGVVLVAVLDQQIAGRFADAHADHVLPVFLELQNEGREVGVARQQDERADFGPREDQLERVDGEPDVGRVLLVRAVRRREDQVDRRLGERDDVLRVAAPVGVGSLHGDLPTDDLGLEQSFQLRLEIGPDAHRHIVEVDE